MPHLHLLLSSNLNTFPFADFAHEAHQLLSQYANIAKCKSKLKFAADTYLGSDNQNQALIYLEVLLLPRPEEVLQEIGSKLFTLLQAYADPLLAEQHLQGKVNVELRVLQHYWQS